MTRSVLAGCKGWPSGVLSLAIRMSITKNTRWQFISGWQKRSKPVTDSKESITFTRAGALAGARRVIPIAVSDCVYGLVFGVLAHQAGLSLLEAALMSGLVVAGSAQLVALGLWV